MSAARTTHANYLMGDSPEEHERLRLQAQINEPFTRGFLLSAGVTAGMRVLDLGCGVGDASLLAAEIVGASGVVIGIDRDVAALEKARTRAARHAQGNTITFLEADVFDFEMDGQFDAVFARYLLPHVPDPAATVRKAAEQVRPGGIICFHEMDFGHPVHSYPEGTLFERMYKLMADTFHHTPVRDDAGLQLRSAFLNAGLPSPTMKAEVPLGSEPGSPVYRWITETLRTLTPHIEKHGLASIKELDFDTLAKRMEAEAVEKQSVVVAPLQFGAWVRKA